MLAEAIEADVKRQRLQVPPRRVRAAREGWLARLRSTLIFAALDGRTPNKARANGPFEPRGSRGFMVLSVVPGILLLLLAGLLVLRPMPSDVEALSSIPVDAPGQTPAEHKLIQNISLLREGVWEAKLPPWSQVPYKGLARVSNPQVHEALGTALDRIASFGEAFGNRALPGVRRDKVFLSQVADLRAGLRTIDAQLRGTRSITAYHLGLLALWAGDAADAEPQFASVLEIARKTEPLDDVGRLRLDGIEASAAYGLALSQAARGGWRNAIANFDVALAASCRAAADTKTNLQADFGFVLGSANLVALDTRSVRNDRLVALLRARNAGDEGARTAVTSPTCAELATPRTGRTAGDADAEARTLFSALAIAGDPYLAANLQLRAALMGERDIVQQLSFDGADATAELLQAQSLARAIVGLEPATDAAADGAERSALADLQKVSILKARLAAQLRNGTLAEPESDPAWVWSDPGLFVDWKNASGALLASALLARAEGVRHDNPQLASALYGVVIDNRAWLPAVDVSEAWWRLNTGTSLAFVLMVVALAALLTLVGFMILRRWRATYRSTFESYHYSDRIQAPEG